MISEPFEYEAMHYKSNESPYTQQTMNKSKE